MKEVYRRAFWTTYAAQGKLLETTAEQEKSSD